MALTVLNVLALLVLLAGGWLSYEFAGSLNIGSDSTPPPYDTKLNKTPGVLASEASVKKYGLAEVEGNPALLPESLESEQNRMTG